MAAVAELNTELDRASASTADPMKGATQARADGQQGDREKAKMRNDMPEPITHRTHPHTDQFKQLLGVVATEFEKAGVDWAIMFGSLIAQERSIAHAKQTLLRRANLAHALLLLLHGQVPRKSAHTLGCGHGLWDHGKRGTDAQSCFRIKQGICRRRLGSRH